MWACFTTLNRPESDLYNKLNWIWSDEPSSRFIKSIEIPFPKFRGSNHRLERKRYKVWRVKISFLNRIKRDFSGQNSNRSKILRKYQPGSTPTLLNRWVVFSVHWITWGFCWIVCEDYQEKNQLRKPLKIIKTFKKTALHWATLRYAEFLQ
jgi:hypothetical protein